MRDYNFVIRYSKNILSLFAILFLLVGCTSKSGNKKLQGNSLSSFLEEVLQENNTTKREVEKSLGFPDKVQGTGCPEETWVYNYIKRSTKPHSFIPVINLFGSGTNDKHKILYITFNQKGVVTKYWLEKFERDTRIGLLK